ncbi:MAG: hypothetical protein QOE59_5403 [Actinomycetota bacterium]|nr:hypothetical protein [Actinomycetota bacterium]
MDVAPRESLGSHEEREAPLLHRIRDLNRAEPTAGSRSPRTPPPTPPWGRTSDGSDVHRVGRDAEVVEQAPPPQRSRGARPWRWSPTRCRSAARARRRARPQWARRTAAGAPPRGPRAARCGRAPDRVPRLTPACTPTPPSPSSPRTSALNPGMTASPAVDGCKAHPPTVWWVKRPSRIERGSRINDREARDRQRVWLAGRVAPGELALRAVSPSGWKLSAAACACFAVGAAGELWFVIGVEHRHGPDHWVIFADQPRVARPLGAVAPSTPFSSAWSMWTVAAGT